MDDNKMNRKRILLVGDDPQNVKPTPVREDN